MDRRGKPYYYLSSADVDVDTVDSDGALGASSREDVAKFLISILCKTRGKNSLGNISIQKFRSIRQLGINTVSALQEFCQSFPQCFTICPSPAGEDVRDAEVEVTTELKLCPLHLRKMGSCPEDGECGYLHMCKFFMLSGKCECGTEKEVPKLFAHQLFSDHNTMVLRHHLMDHLTLEEVRTLVKRRHARTVQLRPFICRFYNNQTGCSKGPRCGALHVCRRFVLEECKFGADCNRSHDLTEPSVKSILDMYDITPEDLPSIMKDGQQELGAVPTSQPLSLTNPQVPVEQSGAGSNPVSTLSLYRKEQDELRGGHWCHPSDKAGSKEGSNTPAVPGGKDGSEESPVSVTYQTLFSRRRGHMAGGASDWQSREGSQGTDGKEDQPAPTGPPSLNPFSYMTVSDRHKQPSTGLNPAATAVGEEKGPHTGDEGAVEKACPDWQPGTEISAHTNQDVAKTKDAYTVRKAEDVLFGQTPNPSFIPLKPVDKTVTVNLSHGRPVASVPPQMKIKPDLGISRKIDISKPSSEDFLVDGKRTHLQNEWKETARSEIPQTQTAVSCKEKVSQSPAAPAPSKAESLQSIIAGLISNVKKLHAQNSGPEQHLVSYLSELAQPDKLSKEMKAAEEESEHRKVEEGNPESGEKYRSDGEISDSDHEMEETSSLKSVQEKVLFDYNHRPTVDLIGEMLNNTHSSPFQDTSDQDMPGGEKACSPPGLERDMSFDHQDRRGSFRRQCSGGRSAQYELVDSPETDRHLEEISSANSAISDIMSSEEDPEGGSGKKTVLSLKDSQNREKMAKIEERPDHVKTSATATTEKEMETLGSQDDGSDEHCAQEQEDKAVTSQTKPSQTVPSEKTNADEKMTTSKMSPHKIQASSERLAAPSSPSVGPKCSPSVPKRSCSGTTSPYPRRSSPGKKSLDPRRCSPCKKSFSLGNKRSSGKPEESDSRSSDPKRPHSDRKSPSSRSSHLKNRGSSPGKNRSSIGNWRLSPEHRRSCLETRGSSGSKRSPAGNRRSSPGTRTSTDLGRVSRVNRSSDRRISSENRSSDPRSSYDRRCTPSPSHKRASYHGRRSPVSLRKCMPSSRGHSPDVWRSSSGWRNTSPSSQKLSAPHRRSSPRTQEEEYATHRHCPSSHRYREGLDRGDPEHQRASPLPYCRAEGRDKVGNSREKERMKKEMDDHRFRRETERMKKEMDDCRFRREKERRAKERNEHTFRSRSRDRWSDSKERTPRIPNPTKDRKRSLSPQRWGATVQSHSPVEHRWRTSDCYSSRKHEPLFDSREGSFDGRPRSEGHDDADVEEWPASERGDGGIPHSLNDDGQRERDEFFYAEHSQGIGPRKSFAQREICDDPEENFWNQDSVCDDRSLASMPRFKQGSIRSKLGSSPILLEDQYAENISPDGGFSERDLQGGSDGYRPSFQGRRYLSRENYNLHMQGSQSDEVSHDPFPNEKDFYRGTGSGSQETAGRQERKTNRGAPLRKFPKTYKFINYQKCAGDNWNSSLTKPEVTLKDSCQSDEDDRLRSPPYTEQSKRGLRQADIHFKPSPHGLPLSHCSHTGFRHHQRDRDWPRGSHRFCQKQHYDKGFAGPKHSQSSLLSQEAGFHMEENNAVQGFRQRGTESFTSPAAAAERVSLRDKIDDLLDKARHSSSRGPSPFQDLDEHFHKSDIRPSEGSMELDDRQVASLPYNDHSPEQQHCKNPPYRHFHSQQKRADEFGPQPSSNRQRESPDRSYALEKKKRVSERNWDPETAATEAKDRKQHRYEREWADTGRESVNSRHEYDLHDSPAKDRDCWDDSLAPNIGGSENPRSHRQYHSKQFRRGTGKYMRNRSGLKIKMVFRDDRHVPSQHDGDAHYQDLDQPYSEEDAEAQLLEPQAEGVDYSRHYGDAFYGEGDGMDQDFHGHPEDVGDMIEAHKARVMRSDLRNLLKSRRRSQHFSQPESEPIQIRVQHSGNRERLTRIKCLNDEREVTVAGRR